jgi:uncharacterized protein (UPF0212 family)
MGSQIPHCSETRDVVTGCPPAEGAVKVAMEALREMLDRLIAESRMGCQAQMQSEKCPECARDWDCQFAVDVQRWRAALAALEDLLAELERVRVDFQPRVHADASKGEE